MMDKMREEFEYWAKVNGLRLERQRSMGGGDMGRYDFGPTQAALEVWCDSWKASRSSLCVELPKTPDFSASDEPDLAFEYGVEVMKDLIESAGITCK